MCVAILYGWRSISIRAQLIVPELRQVSLLDVALTLLAFAFAVLLTFGGFEKHSLVRQTNNVFADKLV